MTNIIEDTDSEKSVSRKRPARNSDFCPSHKERSARGDRYKLRVLKGVSFGKGGVQCTLRCCSLGGGNPFGVIIVNDTPERCQKRKSVLERMVIMLARGAY
ncbi:hypothetical protein HZH68_005085 [Vespula germanica]|uniref:Uncharacterized protein n=1 Tax=Vespula germanica TaxID=30212 RepID=A0A834KH09_VESGE|nr:hypothetical protein HZH68_005085 [Vespula germanica]